MFLSKTIAKLRKKPSSSKKLHKVKPPKDEKRSQRCRYQEIPPVQKIYSPHPIYQICGDIPFMEHEGHLVSDISFFNEFKTYQDITVNDLYSQKVISIKANQRKDKKYAVWAPLVKDLEKSENPELMDWANFIKTFCHTHTKVMQRQSRKRMKSELRRQFFSEVTQETELKIQKLFSSYPCVQFKFRLRNHQMELKEFLFSESFVKELGYSADSFVMTVLEGGIPQLMPYDNPLSELVIKTLIENYFNFGENGHVIPEIESTLLMRSNFAKDVKFQTLFLMNYETSTFGMDVVLAITSKGEPYLIENQAPSERINKDFIQSMAIREEELGLFLSLYYNQKVQKEYTNLYKTCCIRELNYVDDDIIVKKYEEEESLY